MGAPKRSPKAAIDALEEAIAVIRRVWEASDAPASYNGTHYRLEGVMPGPAPAHRIGLRIPGSHDRADRPPGRRLAAELPISGPGGARRAQQAPRRRRIGGRPVAGGHPSLYNVIGRIDPSGTGRFDEGPPPGSNDWSR
jgi:hypothetical protein